jgi:hypothetical protein
MRMAQRLMERVTRSRLNQWAQVIRSACRYLIRNFHAKPLVRDDLGECKRVRHCMTMQAATLVDNGAKVRTLLCTRR